MTAPVDPAAYFREMLGQWEKFANGFGGDVLKTGEFARTMHGASGAVTGAQAAMNQISERALAAANMPSRAEVEDISARIAGIEATLARIEAKLDAAAPPAPRDGPTRARKPPQPA